MNAYVSKGFTSYCNTTSVSVTQHTLFSLLPYNQPVSYYFCEKWDQDNIPESLSHQAVDMKSYVQSLLREFVTFSGHIGGPDVVVIAPGTWDLIRLDQEVMIPLPL